MAIARALRKYGPEAFDWVVLEQHPTFAEAKLAEIRAIAERKPEFNCTAGGDGALDPSPEVRSKMRAAAIGRTRSTETRQRMSEAKLELWQDPAHQAHMSAVNKAMWAADPERQANLRAAGLKGAATRRKRAQMNRLRKAVAEYERSIITWP